MDYIFNDAVMSKKEVSFEYNRIMFFIISKDGKITLTCKDSRYSFPYFDVDKNEEYSDALDRFNKNNLNGYIQKDATPFVRITDYQYRYPQNNFRLNNLVHINCYLINDPNNNIVIEDSFKMHLFEIQDYLQNNKNNDYYHYDNRIIDTILSYYISQNTEMFFDQKNYKNYLINRHYSKDDDDLRSRYRRKKYIESFIGEATIEGICNDSKLFIQDIFEHLEFINDNYASITMQRVSGLKNSNEDWYADVIGTYDDNGEERYLSLYILRNILGSSYSIYLTDHNQEFKDENNNVIGSFIGLPVFYIKGDINNLLDIAIREDSNRLVLEKDK